MYSKDSQQTTGSHQKKERAVARGVLKGVALWEVERAVSRAKRSERDGAGREWQLGTSVAVMVRELLFRDGHGELEDDWIHLSRAQWRLSEYSLTEHKLRTAREKAADEGLVEYQPCIRPGDGRQSTAYRVNMWRLAEVVVESELCRCRELLATEGRKKQRDALNKRRREMEAAKDDLSLIDKLNTVNQGGGVDGTKCHGYLDTLTTIHTKSLTKHEEKKPFKKGFLKKRTSLQTPIKEIQEKLTSEECWELWDELLFVDEHGEALQTLAEVMAECNKTRKVAITRVWRQIGARYLEYRETYPEITEEAWGYGFQETVEAWVWSVGYAKKAALQFVRAPDSYVHEGQRGQIS